MDYYNNPFLNQTPVGFNSRQTITRVNGKDSINSLRMAPNSEMIALDNTAPIAWVCVSDGVGSVRATPYDIAPHKEASPVSDIEQRLSALEKAVVRMGGNYEPGNSAVERGEIPADV